ncbi:MAG: PKD domain-containing protein [Chloroflexota bacterium]
MIKKLLLPLCVLAVILLFTALLATNLPTGLPFTQTVSGKGTALPLADMSNPQRQLAQDLALADARVLHHTSGSRAEVFGVRDMMGQFTAASAECETAVCYQVEIYNFDRNAAITAIVDVEAKQVRDVLYLENAQPGVNKRLADLARELASNHPDVIEALGYRPHDVDVAGVGGGLLDTNCDGRHLCVALIYHQPERLLWAVVDLTLEEVAGVTWTEMPPELPQSAPPFLPQGCPAPGIVAREGWSLSYQTTGIDGLRVHTVSYNGMPVINNIKLVEWHIAYAGGGGFIDIIGCGGSGGGFHIYPYGETEIIDLFDEDDTVIGFEVVQDFRMGNWGANCNYRYDQRLQFFEDGRFRVVGGAYGKGCNTIGVYRPVVRIDIAINGSDNNSFATWDGSDWLTHQEEFWQLQDAPYTDEGYRWQVYNADGTAYYIEPGQGQFEDSPEPDNAYIYVTMHKPEEGDTDLPAIGTCCNSDHQQGPHHFVDGDPIENQNLVIWYVPQMDKYGVAPGPYTCWTVTGEPNPETYPCFSGPMFVPVTHSRFDHNGPVPLNQTAVFTATSTGVTPLSYEWDFGDGIGTSTDPNPTYIFTDLGTYTVTLTTTSAVGESHTTSETIEVLLDMLDATFRYDNPLLVGETAVFTPTMDSEPISYLWDFGDGITSTLISPSHSYGAAGSYTVTLTVTNEVSQTSASALIDVGHVRADLEPAAGAILAYDAGSGQTITATFAGGSVTETVTLLYTALDLWQTAVVPPHMLYAGHGLALTAYSDSLRLPTLPLAEPYHLLFVYDEPFPDRFVPESMRWFYPTGMPDDWQDAAGICSPPSDYVYEPETNRFSLDICGLSRLALVGEPQNRIYLPAIIR